jgi:selenocysteine lyase/cysteine desulfurase
MDIRKVRLQTPSCGSMIHFNNAGCSLMPKPVSDIVFEYLAQEQKYGGYETELERNLELEEFYTSAAGLIGCSADEIAFCDGNTRGWQQFFYSLKFERGDRIITTRVDYGSNMVAYIQMARNKGIVVDFIETDEAGDLDLAHLQSLIRTKTKLISISHIPTGCGIINDAEKIGAIAATAGIPYLLDACQSTGHLNLDVSKLGCTALSTTGRKYLRGSRGSGFLYVARSYFENAEPVMLEQQGVKLINSETYELSNSARMFENYECHVAGKLGLKTAIEYARDIGLDEIESRVKGLAGLCRQGLSEIPNVTVHDRGKRQCGIVTFTIHGQHAAETCSRLRNKKINTWVSTGPGSLIDFQGQNLDAVTRASIHYYNTEQEIETFLEVVAELA